MNEITHQVYGDTCFIIPTKHEKSMAIAPPFWEKLGASVLEYVVDTDTLGTFSGEVERKGNALECARRKCEWTLELLGDKTDHVLASEGSFGPHPYIPFLPCDHEILYFIDRRRGFHLHLSLLSEKTNYQMKLLSSMEELLAFAEAAQFPLHALILRPNGSETRSPIFKDLNTEAALERAFSDALKLSNAGRVWVETDMRAQMNPSRMAVIADLAAEMAARLATACPQCASPGWGRVRSEKGLRCEYCHQTTEMIADEIYGCVLCDHSEKRARADGLNVAPQLHCGWCNP
ncbi:MAG: hypothetical protein ACJA09_002984 [Alcanivorax sp.]|jgi:hypothetical protein